jgi:hypothetical protein
MAVRDLMRTGNPSPDNDFMNALDGPTYNRVLRDILADNRETPGHADIEPIDLSSGIETPGTRRSPRAIMIAACVLAAIGVTVAVIHGESSDGNSSAAGSTKQEVPPRADCGTPPRMINLKSVRAQTSTAPGTPQPDLNNYRGLVDGDDSRNFVAQISGAQAVAAHLTINSSALLTDRIVVIAQYGAITVVTQNGNPAATIKSADLQISTIDITADTDPLIYPTLNKCVTQ